MACLVLHSPGILNLKNLGILKIKKKEKKKGYNTLICSVAVWENIFSK